MGAGSWGTAFALLCAQAGERVVLWARDEGLAGTIDRDHRNPRYLDGVALPDEIRATAVAGEALADAAVVVFAVPSHALRGCVEAWRPTLATTAVLVSLIKGIELTTRLRASQVLQDVLDVDGDRVVVVSGPNLARECAAGLPAATVAASGDAQACVRVQRMCHSGAFRVYTNTDQVGVELGGAVKNPIAIAAGIADGMGYGANTKSMLITRGLAEMTRLGTALGADPLTFAGLAGMGDLVATCTSPQSRNRGVGEQLGRGRPLPDVVREMRMVAEGVKSSRGLLELAQAQGVEMPIVEQVVRIVHEDADPVGAVRALMGRTPKPEVHGWTQTSTPGSRARTDVGAPQ